MRVKLENIQALRAAAVFAVVSFHVAAITSEWGGSALLKPFLYFGFAGVDLFFVISGFIMVTVHRRDLGNPAYRSTFVRKRFLRIMPTYWIAWLIAAALFAWYYGFPPPCYGSESATLPLLKSLFLLPSAHEHCLIPQAWTLNYEMYFYLAFAVLAFLPRQVIKPVFAAWFTLSLIATLLGPDRMGVFYRFNAINLYFLSGCALAVVPRQIISKNWIAFGTLGIAGWVGSGWAYSNGYFQPGDIGVRFAYFGISSILIVASAIGSEGKFRVPQFALLIGNASYAIYLLHMAAMLPIRLAVSGVVQPPVLLLATVLLVVSIASGIIYHLLIERHIQFRPPTRAVSAAE
jgi:peptidoglycan/LPS O-acetylase OafA/YrhL